MNYGNGEKFEGEFVDGSEEGEGILYKNGSTKKVKYTKGKLLQELTIVTHGGNALKLRAVPQRDC